MKFTELEIANQVIANLRAEIEKLQKENNYLEERDHLLSALEAGGVDNWKWYSESIEDYEKRY